VRYKTGFDTLNRLGADNECDRQTDRQTDCRTGVSNSAVWRSALKGQKILSYKWAATPRRRNVCLRRWSIHTFVHIWPWPLTSDLENLSSNSHFFYLVFHLVYCIFPTVILCVNFCALWWRLTKLTVKEIKGLLTYLRDKHDVTRVGRLSPDGTVTDGVTPIFSSKSWRPF